MIAAEDVEELAGGIVGDGREGTRRRLGIEHLGGLFDLQLRAQHGVDGSRIDRQRRRYAGHQFLKAIGREGQLVIAGRAVRPMHPVRDVASARVPP